MTPREGEACIHVARVRCWGVFVDCYDWDD